MVAIGTSSSGLVQNQVRYPAFGLLLGSGMGLFISLVFFGTADIALGPVFGSGIGPVIGAIL